MVHDERLVDAQLELRNLLRHLAVLGAKVSVGAMRRVQLTAEGAVVRLGRAALRVEQIKGADSRLVEDLAHLGIVGRVHRGHWDALPRVQRQLVHKDLLHEEGMEPLVCVVDAELLERVLLKPLEAEDVEEADRAARLLILPNHQRGIDGEHHVVEDARVHLLDESVTRLGRVHRLQCHLDGLAGSDDRLGEQVLAQLLHAQVALGERERRLRRLRDRCLLIALEGHVA